MTTSQTAIELLEAEIERLKSELQFAHKMYDEQKRQMNNFAKAHVEERGKRIRTEFILNTLVEAFMNDQPEGMKVDCGFGVVETDTEETFSARERGVERNVKAQMRRT